jgi:cytoskeletal protein RodZ
MKTVGQILKARREASGRDLDNIAKVTKIRKDYLEALENDDYHKLPGATYAKGFIKNYAQSLGMNTRTLVAIFRRDFAEDEKGQIIPRGKLEPLDKSGWSWTPQLTVGLIVVFLITLIAGYFGFQYYRLWNPALKVTEPIEGEILVSGNVQVSGQADPSSTVRVNEHLVIVDANGNFDTTLTLEQGEQIIKVVAETEKGGTTERERKIEVREIE